jgi:hypothetical protein
LCDGLRKIRYHLDLFPPVLVTLQQAAAGQSICV